MAPPRHARTQSFCIECQCSFGNHRGLVAHYKRVHRDRKPRTPKSKIVFHPHLNGTPCDINGTFLPENTPPPPPDVSQDWSPFQRHSQFSFTELMFEKAENSASQVDELCKVLAAEAIYHGVATGHTEFHPLYLSLGNVGNEMRRAHREAVIPLAFLSIPKAARADADTDEFRLFRKQLYHSSIAHILEPLRPGMTTPHILKCPDGHYRGAIFELGPFIADYPEQVMLAGIVQGWCPKCLSPSDDLTTIGPRRSRDLDSVLRETYHAKTLWDTFGMDAAVMPYTDYFPRADIHELLSPDLLHQLIKGTFKDHLVAWVEDYIRLTNPKHDADKIMDDIDRRIAASPSFPGLRRFPEGRNFAQWTGNDSKALMKVFIPAIVGYIPDRMVKCMVALMDFCYLARRPSHDTLALQEMDAALARFHHYRPVFEELGVRPSGFALPRQHALVHYVRSIRLFGSPNGLCSSITESKHIVAVKKPWRRSNRHNPLGQIIRTITRLAKLAAIRVKADMGLEEEDDDDRVALALRGLGAGWRDLVDEREAAGVEEDIARTNVRLGKRPVCSQPCQMIAQRLGQPRLRELCRRFLHDQLYDTSSDTIPLPDLPPFNGNVALFYSASATYYAPSEECGTGGMHREIIRSNPSWYDAYSRYDTVLVQEGDENDLMGGMLALHIALYSDPDPGAEFWNTEKVHVILNTLKFIPTTALTSLTFEMTFHVAWELNDLPHELLVKLDSHLSGLPVDNFSLVMDVCHFHEYLDRMSGDWAQNPLLEAQDYVKQRLPCLLEKGQLQMATSEIYQKPFNNGVDDEMNID
ncbi:hypothetical protein EUX98_g2771 [Antrodiella citrinella]|uniref:C2H2-type domain-containing protein n=1 Tax=Antrodiella citrinella TaxID=2447956 RepID=A0A4S4MZH0_9APHY|nr:hypothetical protein EUX98_g2771 [Antrodiella citrinella]